MKRLLVIFAFSYIGVATAQNAAISNSLTITEKGIGPINSKTPFNRKEVQKLLPNLKVTEGTSMTEGEEFPILEVSDKKGLLFTINPDGKEKQIFSVVIEKDRVANSVGHKIGQTFKEVYAGYSPQCNAGMEEQSGTVMCMAPNSKHIGYQFSEENGWADGEVPPSEVLNKWTLTTIYWKPWRCAVQHAAAADMLHATLS